MNYMQLAIEQAQAAAARGEVPIGAVMVGPDGQVLAAHGNEVEARKDPTAHAELLCIKSTSKKLGETRINNCDLYVTLEPCPMCAAALSFARIRRLYFGAYDPKGGGVDHGPKIFQQPTCHHTPDVYGGIEESACAALLKSFFGERR